MKDRKIKFQQALKLIEQARIIAAENYKHPEFEILWNKIDDFSNEVLHKLEDRALATESKEDFEAFIEATKMTSLQFVRKAS